MPAPVDVRLIVLSLATSSVAEESTSTAVICPPATTVIVPSSVSTLVSSIASVSSIFIAPTILDVASRLAIVVSRSIPPVASAVNTSAITSAVTASSFVIAPACASRTTSLFTPAFTYCASIPAPVEVKLIVLSLVSSSVALESTFTAVIWPPATTVIVPSAVSTSVSSIAFSSSIFMSPVPETLASKLATIVSSPIPVTASTVSSSAITSTDVPNSVTAPEVAVKNTSFCIMPAHMLPAYIEEAVNVMSFVPSSVLEVLTSIADINPPAVTLTSPSEVSTTNRVISSVSSISTSPTPDTLASNVATSISRSIPVTASAVNRLALTSTRPLSVIAPPVAFKNTTFCASISCCTLATMLTTSISSAVNLILFVPSSTFDVSTSVAVIAPEAVILTSPSCVSTSNSSIAPVSSISISPVPDTLASNVATIVSRSIPAVASAVNTSAITSAVTASSFVIAPDCAFNTTSSIDET